MKYDIKNNPDWLNKGPWYNTAICYKLHGTVFEVYIRSSISDIYNLICYITVHDKLIPTYVYDLISGDGRAIPNNSTTEVL